MAAVLQLAKCLARTRTITWKAELIAKRNEHIADINANGHDFILAWLKEFMVLKSY